MYRPNFEYQRHSDVIVFQLSCPSKSHDEKPPRAYSRSFLCWFPQCIHIHPHRSCALADISVSVWRWVGEQRRKKEIEFLISCCVADNDSRLRAVLDRRDQLSSKGDFESAESVFDGGRRNQFFQTIEQEDLEEEISPRGRRRKNISCFTISNIFRFRTFARADGDVKSVSFGRLCVCVWVSRYKELCSFFILSLMRRRRKIFFLCSTV